MAPSAGPAEKIRTNATLLIAEDYPLVRHGLRALFEREGFEVVAEAGDGREAVALAAACKPDIAILDVVMPELNGLDAAREIPRVSARTRCILLTAHFDESSVVEAVRAGVSGYLIKSVAMQVLVHGMRQVEQGGLCMCPMACRVLADAFVQKKDPPDEPLSKREREVLQLIAEGRTAKVIATRLDVSVKTAESHRARIMEKLNIRTTAGLVRYAIRRGLIQA